jgi:hypothetical protein
LTHTEDIFVPVTGVIRLTTTVGVFLDIENHPFFIPANCTSLPSQAFAIGDPATIMVLRSFAEREGLPQADLT